MKDKAGQPKLLDLFLEDLIQNPRISPPADLNLEIAETTRDVVLSEQHGTAFNLNQKMQGRVWERVLDEAELLRLNPKLNNTGSTNWSRFGGVGLQMAAALAIAVLVLILAVGLNNQANTPAQVAVAPQSTTVDANVETSVHKRHIAIVNVAATPEPEAAPVFRAGLFFNQESDLSETQATTNSSFSEVTRQDFSLHHFY